MKMLASASDKFRIAASDDEENKWHVHLPDAVIEPFFCAAEGRLQGVFEEHLELLATRKVGLAPLDRHRLLLPEPRVAWHEACDLVLEAFDAFDPRLGDRAREVLHDPGRLKLQDVAAGNACGRFVGSMAEIERRPAPIEYERDGTINDVLYLAHELGHLLASDAALAKAPPPGVALQRYHLGETQAYFTQMIAYQHLFEQGAGELQRAAYKHFVGEIARGMYQLPLCAMAANLENGTAGDGSGEKVLQGWLGDAWWHYDQAAEVSARVVDDSGLRVSLMRSLHKHVMGPLLAAGFLRASKDRSLEERQAVVTALIFDTSSDTTILTALQDISANSK